MSNKLEIISQHTFIAKIENSVDSLYATDSVFTLISIELGGIGGTKEVFGLLARHIKRAIVNEKDCFSFWENSFYVLTHIDNEDVVKNFINALALIIEQRYGNKIFLKVGYIQYPYDVIDIKNIFEELNGKKSKIIAQKADLETGLAAKKDFNQILAVELTKYLNSLKEYGESLYKHSIFVAKVSIFLAKALKLSNITIKKIAIASILHDVGYLWIPRRLLIASSVQNMKTFTLLKMHPLLASRKILSDKIIFKEILPYVEQHHEYLDGTGYPFGISGDDLPLESQIISMADTFDFIKSNRNLANQDIASFFVERAGFSWNEKLVTIFSAILMDKKQSDSLEDDSDNPINDFLNWN